MLHVTQDRQEGHPPAGELAVALAGAGAVGGGRRRGAGPQHAGGAARPPRALPHALQGGLYSAPSCCQSDEIKINHFT